MNISQLRHLEGFMENIVSLVDQINKFHGRDAGANFCLNLMTAALSCMVAFYGEDKAIEIFRRQIDEHEKLLKNIQSLK